MKTLPLITKQHCLKQAALAVKAQLDDCAVGFGDDRRFTSLVSPDPFPITMREYAYLTQRGFSIRNWLSTTFRLYHQSLSEPALHWLRDLLETGLSDAMREIHRRLFTDKPMRLPLFARTDQPTFNRIAELQTPGSGWGYHAALATCYPGKEIIGRTFVARVADQIRIVTGQERPRVIHLLHKGDFYGSEARFFARAIRQLGIDFTISERVIPDDIGDYDIVLRHYLEELNQYRGWQRLLELYAAGGIEIEPPPTVITDHKIAMCLPFHPATFGYYTNAERALFPTTYLVDAYSRYNIKIDGTRQSVRLSEIAAIPAKKRKLVLKYAGMHPQKRAGGRGVLNLSFCSAIKAKALLEQALDDSYHGEPWLLQELVSRRYPVTYLSASGEIERKELFARLNPFYAFPACGGSEVIGFPAHFRDFWKVHGQPDAVETIVAVT